MTDKTIEEVSREKFRNWIDYTHPITSIEKEKLWEESWNACLRIMTPIIERRKSASWRINE